jgi:hypothetical protein
MPTEKQQTAAKANIKKAAATAKKRRTIGHLPEQTRTALGKQGARPQGKSAANDDLKRKE